MTITCEKSKCALKINENIKFIIFTGSDINSYNFNSTSDLTKYEIIPNKIHQLFQDYFHSFEIIYQLLMS